MEEMLDTTNTRQIGKIWKYVKDGLVPDINEALEPLQGDHETLQEAVKDITAIQGDLDTVESSIGAVSGSVGVLGDRVTAVEGSISTQAGQISALQNTVGEQEDDISDIHATDALQEQRIASLENKVITESQIVDGVGAGRIQFVIKQSDGTPITSNNFNMKAPTGYTLGMGGSQNLYAEITLSDGTTIRSNDLLLDGVVTEDTYFSSFTFIEGSQVGYISAQIGLSNGTVILANDFALPVPSGVSEAIETLQEQMDEVMAELGNMDTNPVVLTSPYLNALVNKVGDTQTGAPVNIIQSVLANTDDNVLTVSVNGSSSEPGQIVKTNSVSVSGNTLTSAVNGKTSTTSVVTSHTLTSSGNTITSAVNGVSKTANAVNSVSGSYDASSKKLTISVNGVGADINFPEMGDDAIEINTTTIINFATAPSMTVYSNLGLAYYISSLTKYGYETISDVVVTLEDNTKVKLSRYPALMWTYSQSGYYGTLSETSSINVLNNMGFKNLPNGSYQIMCQIWCSNKSTASGSTPNSSTTTLIPYLMTGIHVNNGTVTIEDTHLPFSYNFSLKKYTSPYISWISKYE